MTTLAYKQRVFYGWWVVAAAFTVTLFGFGSAYSFSAFIEPLQREFGASRGAVSLVFSLAGFLYFALGIVSGPLADRWGARRLSIAGMLLVGAGLALASVARNIAEVYVAYGLGVGLGVGCAYVPAVGAVQRWFVKRRGLASGLAVSGIGVGTLVMPPLAALLIDGMGWRDAYLVLGALSAVLGVGASLLLENDPGDRGLAPDGEPLAAQAHAVPRAAGMPVRDAVRTPAFLSLYAACLVASFGVFVPFVHLVPHAQDLGIAQGSSVLLLGVIGIGSTAGRFFLGSVADRMGRQRFLLCTVIALAFTLMIWAAASGFWMLAAFAFLFGACYGGWVAVLPAVVMDLFGGRHVAGIIGVLYTSVAFGTLIGPSAAGFAFDASRSYTVPILAAVAANLIAGAILLRAARKPAPVPAQ